MKVFKDTKAKAFFIIIIMSILIAIYITSFFLISKDISFIEIGISISLFFTCMIGLQIKTAQTII